MTQLWKKISEQIVAPSQLSIGQLLRLLVPSGRSIHLTRHAATVILARAQLIAAFFAVLVPLFSIVDLLVFDASTAMHLMGLRLASTLIFVALAWPRALSDTNPYTQALTSLLVLLLVPPCFHLISADMLAAASHTETQKLVSQLYAYLPMIVLGGLAIFPLTALENALLALPVVGIGIIAALFADIPLTLQQLGGTLWFMLMMLGVAMFSGMSQSHYMATLVLKAMHDPLTGAYTRASGEEALNLQLRLNQMTNKPLSLIFFDLDHFKSINDTFGHEAGDACLKMLVDNVSKGLRRSDILIRWGGEEFVAVLPDTPIENIAILLQRLRQNGLGTRPDGSPLTASIGVAHSQEDSVSSWAMLVQRADQRMYIAKQNGRDRAVLPNGTELRLTPNWV